MRKERIVVGAWGYQEKPIVLTERLVLLHPWQAEEWHQPILGRQPIFINPGVAFPFDNIGLSLSLKLLETYGQSGRFLDVATGAAVKAIAAQHLFPQAVIEAFDSDGDIVDHAYNTLLWNGLADRINLQLASLAHYEGKQYMVVMADTLAREYALTQLVELVVVGGHLILAGLTSNSTIRFVGWHRQLINCVDYREIQAILPALGCQLQALEICESAYALIAQRVQEIKSHE